MITVVHLFCIFMWNVLKPVAEYSLVVKNNLAKVVVVQNEEQLRENRVLI